MSNQSQRNLQERAQKAILQESFMRWESAAVIGLSVILTTLAGTGLLPGFLDIIPSWSWLLGGAIAEAGLVYSSLSDPEFGRDVVARLLKREFKPERLHDKSLQQRFQEALDYRTRIEKAIRERDDSMIKNELTQTADQMDEWLENIYDLARRIDRYQQERDVLERDQKRTESRVQQLSRRLQVESDPAVKAQIQATLASMEQQLQTLHTLAGTIQRARLQFENSLVHLGTIYSQTMLVDAKDIDSGRARRLRHEITEEVQELNDLLLSMDDVYNAESAA